MEICFPSDSPAQKRPLETQHSFFCFDFHFLKFRLFASLLCMFVHLSAYTACMEGRGQHAAVILPSHHVDSRDQTEVIRLCHRRLYPRSLLTGPLCPFEGRFPLLCTLFREHRSFPQPHLSLTGRLCLGPDSGVPLL